MVISDQHKYLFIELPHTGSTAVQRELCELYGGRQILVKHATYQDFLEVATPKQRSYFTFGCIRNPLDIAVSLYVRYKNDPYHVYSDPREMARKNFVDRIRYGRSFRFIQRTGADFSTYFLRFYWLPYDTWSNLSFRHCDFVMRFKNLHVDFPRALRMAGIEPRRRLPVVNSTGRGPGDFASYYSPEAIRRAKRVFANYMERWDYEFPAGWGTARASAWDHVALRLVNVFRFAYWRHVRPKLMGIRSAGQEGLPTT